MLVDGNADRLTGIFTPSKNLVLDSVPDCGRLVVGGAQAKGGLGFAVLRQLGLAIVRGGGAVRDGDLDLLLFHVKVYEGRTDGWLVGFNFLLLCWPHPRVDHSPPHHSPTSRPFWNPIKLSKSPHQGSRWKLI